MCESDEIDGCTDDIACNYDINTTEDDGSCEYSSCADCNGIPFGNAILDECGTCDNDHQMIVFKIVQVYLVEMLH